MKHGELKAIVEGLLFASGDEGMTVKQIMKILEVEEDTVLHLLDELTYDYEHTMRGMQLMKSHDVYHLTTKPEHSQYFKKMYVTQEATRLSQAALETLAIVAYLQPITRVEIEEIRGVNSERALKTLQARLLIDEVGRKDTVGRPILFGTTKEFLTFFGLSSLEELPPLQETFAEEDIDLEASKILKAFHLESRDE